MIKFLRKGDLRTSTNEHGVAIITGRLTRDGRFDAMPWEVNKDDNGADWEIEIPLKEVEKLSKSVKGLPVTLFHDSVNEPSDAQKIIGRVVSDGVMVKDGEHSFLEAEILIEDANILAYLETADIKELSIGFVAEMTETEFGAIYKNLKLNHVSMVKAGRAGEKARLVGYNAIKKESDEMTKNIEELQAKFDELKLENDKLKAENDALLAKTTEDEVTVKATEIARDHAEFSALVEPHGVTLKFGEYDKVTVLTDILKKNGRDVAGKSLDFMIGAVSNIDLKDGKQKHYSFDITGFESKPKISESARNAFFSKN